MKTFDEFKTEFIQACKDNNACQPEVEAKNILKKLEKIFG